MRECGGGQWKTFDAALACGPAALADAVHVLRLTLPLADGALHEALHCLPYREREQSERYVHDQDRQHFLGGRIAAYALLAWLTGEPVDRISLAADTNGKPYLPGRADLPFNISHSGDVVLVAFATGAAAGGALGVDVEQVRNLRNSDALAQTAFAPTQIATLDALPTDQRDAYFFAVWTEQEALLKATGDGLAGLPALHTDPAYRNGWAMHRLRPAPGHTAALACRNNRAELRLWQADIAEMTDLLFENNLSFA